MSAWPVNPVVSGLTHAFSLATQFQNQKNQQQALLMQQHRDEEDVKVRDMKVQDNLLDRGYKPSTADQDAEILSGKGKAPMGDVPGIIGQVQTGPAPDSDIKTRMAKYNGQNYVRDSDAEIATKAKKLKATALADKLEETTAVEGVKTAAKKTQQQNSLDILGIPMADATADRVGLKRGSKVMQGPGFAGGISALLKGNAPAAPPKLGQQVNDETGDVTPTALSMGADGKPLLTTGTAAKGIGKTRPPARGDSLTAWEQLQGARQQKNDAAKAAKDHVTAQAAAQKSIDALDKLEQPLHNENRQLGALLIAGSNGTATDAKGKKITITPAMVAQMKARIGENSTKAKGYQDRKHNITMQFAGSGPDGSAPAGNPQDPAGIL